MAGDMDKIIEISLAKIESSKSRKVTGKSNMLHRNLLVNTLLNRVRTTEKYFPEPLMNYREPRGIVDMDTDDYDMEKIPTLKECSNSRNFTQQTTTRKQSSLLSKLNTRSLSGKNDHLFTKHETINETKENKMNQNISCECLKTSKADKTAKKRSRQSEIEDQGCPTKKLRCLWPNLSPKVQELSYSITSLASLFGDLVANTEPESINLGSNYVSAMVAC